MIHNIGVIIASLPCDYNYGNIAPMLNCSCSKKVSFDAIIMPESIMNLSCFVTLSHFLLIYKFIYAINGCPLTNFVRKKYSTCSYCAEFLYHKNCFRNTFLLTRNIFFGLRCAVLTYAWSHCFLEVWDQDVPPQKCWLKRLTLDLYKPSLHGKNDPHHRRFHPVCPCSTSLWTWKTI